VETNLQTITPQDLKDRQERLGLSNREMARRLGVHRNTYENWTAGRHPIPPMASLAVDTLLNQADEASKAGKAGQ